MCGTFISTGRGPHTLSEYVSKVCLDLRVQPFKCFQQIRYDQIICLKPKGYIRKSGILNVLIVLYKTGFLKLLFYTHRLFSWLDPLHQTSEAFLGLTTSTRFGRPLCRRENQGIGLLENLVGISRFSKPFWE